MKRLFVRAPTRKFAKGQIIIYEGDPIETIYYLINGYVKVSHILSDGNQRTIVIYAPGDAFPLVSFLADMGTASYFYECLTDVEVASMPQIQFQQKIKGNLELGEELIAYTYTLNQQFLERIDTLAAQNARQKVVSLFEYLGHKAGVEKDGKIRLKIPLTSRQIAEMCGITRETASMQLTRLKKDGAIEGKRCLVLNPHKLHISH